jgi:hypothetical protein
MFRTSSHSACGRSADGWKSLASTGRLSDPARLDGATRYRTKLPQDLSIVIRIASFGDLLQGEVAVVPRSGGLPQRDAEESATIESSFRLLRRMQHLHRIALISSRCHIDVDRSLGLTTKSFCWTPACTTKDWRTGLTIPSRASKLPSTHIRRDRAEISALPWLE